MNESIITLPGDIPGLLRDGSIIRHRGQKASALQVTEGFVLVAHHASGTDEEIEVDGGTVPWELVSLDLSNDTSRWHAARWCNDRQKYVTFIEQFTVDAAIQGRHMTPAQIDLLARLVLRLAGRTP